jgi:hypothetical protein
MWPRLGCALALVGCYSGRALPGAPCTPALQNCPSGQTCELVGGEYQCAYEPSVVDASTNPDDGSGGGSDASPTDSMAGDGTLVVPWTLVQTRASGNNDNDVTTTASGAGNIIIAAIETTANNAVTTVTDNAGNTYVPVAGSRSKNTVAAFGVELWYANNVAAGATQVTATGVTIYGIAIWEVAGIDSTSPLGNVVKIDDQGGSMTPSGAPITTTTTGEFVISIVIVENTVSSIVAGSFTNDHSIFQNGWAHLTSNTAPPNTYTAQWNQPSGGTSCASSVAFRRGL